MGFGAAAVVPHPPLLVESLAGSEPDDELASLRAACLAAVAAVAGAELLVVVGDGPVWGAVVPGAAGSLAPWGAPPGHLELGAITPPELAGVPEPAAVTHLPLSLTIAAWLLAQVDPPAHLAAFCVPAAMPPAAAAGIGRSLAAAVGERQAALLVMADGSARRATRSPGTFHPGAEAADAAVAAALARADLGALMALDPAACTELWLGGRVPLQVLAGALAGVALSGEVAYDAAPSGVGYVVATMAAP